MLKEEKVRSILVVDSNLNFLEEVRSDSQAKTTPPLVARISKEAQLILADQNILLLGIFVDPEISTPERGPGGISVIRFSQLQRPAMPIFAICNGDCKIPLNELKELGVKDVISKPLVYTQMVELVAPIRP